MFLTSVKTRGNFSPARNVLSTTEPELTLFTFVRTKAPPLPGFTCWKSTIRQTEPSSSMCIPVLNSLVLTTSATARAGYLTVVSCLSAWVSRSLPPSVTSTMSSIRTPPTSGR